MDVLAGLAPFVPLAQTLLWVLLVLAIALWFNKQIRSVLRAIQLRIEAGSGVKAGPFELSELLRPQSPEVQKQRAQAEASEAVPVEQGSERNVPPVTITDVTSQYLQSEDLALRAVQAEYGVAISRQVSLGPDTEFDAVFFRDQDVYVVEVKLFLGSVTTAKLRSSLHRVASSARRWAGPRVRIALVIVFKREEDISANEPRVREAFEDLQVPVELWLYSLPALRSKFGA